MTREEAMALARSAFDACELDAVPIAPDVVRVTRLLVWLIEDSAGGGTQEERDAAIDSLCVLRLVLRGHA